jgi:hypothetical protein
MFCNVCGCHVLEPTEYRTGKVGGHRAPAGRCTSCGAITLREDFASTPEERDSTRIAIALRQAVSENRPLDAHWRRAS